jgi:hypothetical protein
MSSSNSVLRNPNSHFGTLGALWIVYGVLRLILAACLLIYAGTATLMFGALLNRVADPFTLMSVFHFLYAATIVLSVACGLIAIFAGLALLGGRSVGRKLAILASVLSLCDVPLGITLGTFTLVEFLPIETPMLYGRSGQPA